MQKYFSFFVIVLFLNLGCQKAIENTATSSIPLAPTNLVATVISSVQVNLSWKDNSTTESGFKIERKIATGNYSVISNGTPDITVYKDSGLIANTSYTYRVSSFNSIGPSITYSNEVTVVTNPVASITVPTLTTRNISDTTGSSAVSGGNIIYDGGAPISVRGIVWSTSSNPTISLSTKTVEGTGSGNFISTLTGLAVNTKYFVRAYATNSSGTGYGNEMSFTTTSINLNTGLVVWYPFNGSLSDSSINKYNGTNNGATYSTDRFGAPNNAILFTPNTNFNTPSLMSLSGAQSFSISFWRRYSDTISAGIQFITTVNNKFYLSLERKSSYPGLDSLTLTYSSSGTGTNLKTTYKSWQHIVMQFDGPKGKYNVFIDGSLYRSENLTTNPFPALTTNDRFTFTNSGNFPINSFNKNGELDELRFYNRLLTDQEIVYLSKN